MNHAKKSRKVFTELIYEIEKAAQSQKELKPNSLKQRLEKRKKEKEEYRSLYHQSLNRELMLFSVSWRIVEAFNSGLSEAC